MTQINQIIKENADVKPLLMAQDSTNWSLGFGNLIFLLL